MNRLSKFLKRGIAQQERMLGNPFFIFKGQKIPCLPGSDVEESFDMEFGGNSDQSKCEILVRKNLFRHISEYTIDSTDLTIDSTKYIVDRYGNLFPNYDLRRQTVEHLLQFKRSITLDNKDIQIDDNCNITIDSDVPGPGILTPTIDSVNITIDDAKNITIDALGFAGVLPQKEGDGYVVPDLVPIPGSDPITIDNNSKTIDDNKTTVDHHVDMLGYFDPIVLPDFDNIFAEELDQGIERRKSELEQPQDYARTIDDRSVKVLVDNPFGGINIDKDDPAWERPERVPGVYQEDQDMNYARKLKVDDILEYNDKPFRVSEVKDAGVFDAFYRVILVGE